MNMRMLYLKITRCLPQHVVNLFEEFPLHPFYLLYKYEARKALRSGPPYYPSHKKIIIDITTACNLNCIDCARSCGKGQANAAEHMSVRQIEKFVKETVHQDKKWKEIIIEGGEPTLHPQFLEILDILLSYKEKYSPLTNLKVLTNGHGDTVNKVISSIPSREVDVYNSMKKSANQKQHCAFNIAPCDLPEFQNTDFSQGCYLPACFGLGLTKYGFYPHPICGGIDRVLGFDIGRKTLPELNDLMKDQFEKLCGFCGYFRYCTHLRQGNNETGSEKAPKGQMSAAWKEVYSQYRKNKPILKEY